MEFLFGFFAGVMALNFWWLAFILVLIISEVICSHDENYALASTLLILAGLATLGINWWSNDISPLETILLLLPYLFIGLPLYLLLGGLWSLFKWKQYLLKAVEEHKANIAHRQRFNVDVDRSRPASSYAKNNKEKITGWIAYWPFSMLGALFGDFLTWAVRGIYRALAGVYEDMGNKMFKDFE